MEEQLRTSMRYGWLETWLKAVSWPNGENYKAIAPDRSTRRTVVWVAAGSSVSAITTTAVLGFVIIGLTAMSGGSSPLLPTGRFAELFLLAAAMLPAIAISGVAMFFIDTAIVHGLARLLGGQGEYKSYTYVFAAINTPIQISTSALPILFLIPIIGGTVAQMISFVVGFYLMAAQISAVKALYKINTANAAVAVIALRTLAALAAGLIIAVMILVTSLR